MTPSQIQNAKQPQSDCLRSELFESYTPTKDSLSKPMPQWIFHRERGRAGENKGGGRRQRERGRETPGETGESEGEAAERGRLAGEH